MLIWLKIVLEDLEVKWAGTMKLYYNNNKSAINIALNLIQHGCTKHVDVEGHFIKDKLDSGLISTPYVSTTGPYIDILTKGLPSHSFQQITSKLGMDIYSPTWGGVLTNHYGFVKGLNPYATGIVNFCIVVFFFFLS